MRIARRYMLSVLATLALAGATPLCAQKIPGTKSGIVKTADGTKIHYLAAGHTGFKIIDKGHSNESPRIDTNPELLFIPGWTMPAWIWEHQITHFAKTHRVIAIDPRGQGESSKPREGYFPAQRARDIRAVIEQLKLTNVVLVGWSMGVADIAAYVEQFGTADVRAIVLADGLAGGFDAQFTAAMLKFSGDFQKDREKTTGPFVRSMFRTPQTEDYLERLTASALQTPTDAAVALFVGAFTADLRPALTKIDKPTLVLAAGDEKTNPWVPRYREMADSIPGARLELPPGTGHALFVDDAARFNSLLEALLSPPARTPPLP